MTATLAVVVTSASGTPIAGVTVSAAPVPVADDAPAVVAAPAPAQRTRQVVVWAARPSPFPDAEPWDGRILPV